MAPRYQRRSPLAVVEELLHWQRTLGLSEVAFYDDALLVQAETHLLPILEVLASRGARCRFHTPNALHARYIDREVAMWLKRANFATLRLGVETAAPGKRTVGRKTPGRRTGSSPELPQGSGLPPGGHWRLPPHRPAGQTDEEVAASIHRVRELGSTPVLALYSPISGTKLWPEALAASPYGLEHEPLYHNNSLFPCWPAFSWKRYTRLKRLAQGL